MLWPISLLVAGLSFPFNCFAETGRCSHNPLLTSSASSWSIDLLSYDSRAQAEGLVYRLAKKQFTATVAATAPDVINNAENQRFQVRMTGFASQEEAVACQALLQSRTSIRDHHIRIVTPSQPPAPPVQASQAVEPEAVEVNEPEPDQSTAVVNGMSLQQVISFGLANNVQYREQVSGLPILDLDVDAASDPFAIKTNISSSSSQRVGSEIGQDYQINFNKKFSPGTRVGVGFGTARFSGQSLSEASVSLSQPLLKGRGTLVNTVGILEAEQNRLRQRNLIGQHKQKLILDIISAYYRTVLQQQSIRIHEATIKQSKNMLDSSNAKFKFGMVSRMDVFRAELQLLEAQEALATARSNHEKSLDELKLLIGGSIEDDLVLSDPIHAKQMHLSDEDMLVQQALDSRPELANLKLEQEMLAKKIVVAENSMLPQLDVTVQLSQSGTAQTFSKSTRLNDTRVGVGISGSPDFSMASEKANYRRQLLRFENAKRKYRQAQETIRSAVKDKVRQVKQGQKRILIRQRKVEAAEKQKQYALVRYQKGLVDNTTVVDAEKSMVGAKISHLQAIVDYNISLFALYQSAG